MSATKYIAKGSIFGRMEGLSKEEIKKLDWMYSVKTTSNKSLANLHLSWENGRMIYKSVKSIRRGEKFMLFDNKSAHVVYESEDEEENSSDNSNGSSGDWTPRSIRKSVKRSARDVRKNRGNPKYNDDNSDEESDDSSVKKSNKNKNEENSDEEENSEPDCNSLIDNNDQRKRSHSSDSETNSDGEDENLSNKNKRQKSEPEMNNDGGDETNESEVNSDKEDITKYTCKTCSKVFTKQEVLDEHEKKHRLVITMHSCELCRRSFVYKRSLLTHLRDDHKGRTLEEIEKRKKRNDEEMKKRKKRNDEEMKKKKKKNSNEEKGNNANDLKSKKSIFNSVMPNDKFKCNECGKEFRWKTSYDDHVAIHRRDFVCKICDKVFGRKIFLDNHKVSHKKEEREKKKNSKEAEMSSCDEEIEPDKSDGGLSSGEESDKPNYRRSIRNQKPKSMLDEKKRDVRSCRRANKIKPMVQTSDDNERIDVKSKSKENKKIKKMDLSAYNLKECYVKLDKLSSEKINGYSWVEENNEDTHKCFYCGFIYEEERLWLNHMKKFHS